jgi:hypothetical protein
MSLIVRAAIVAGILDTNVRTNADAPSTNALEASLTSLLSST